MATPSSDGGGGPSSTVTGGQNADKATDKAKKKSDKAKVKKGSSDSSYSNALGLVISVLYYVFLVYYMVNFTEKWWHAALGIGVASASLLLSLYLVVRQYVMTPGKQNVGKPHQDSDGDLGRVLLASENLLKDNVTVGGTV